VECFVEANQGYEANVRVYCAIIDQNSYYIRQINHPIDATLTSIVDSNHRAYLEDVTHECPHRNVSRNFFNEVGY
jgi:hypothetical protein